MVQQSDPAATTVNHDPWWPCSYFLVTVSVAVAVWLRLPLTPVTVSVKVPLTPVTVWTVIVELVAAGLGLKTAVPPEGRPLTVRLTEPLKPLAGEMVTV